MSAKSQISVRRPARPEADQPPSPMPITQAGVPVIDPDNAAALAYTLRGRTAAAEAGPPKEIEPQGQGGTRLGSRSDVTEAVDDEVGHVSVKLPPDVSRKLSAIADRRGSKRTRVALEVLEQPLRSLAAQHRAGQFPNLPKVVSGSVRSSVAFTLPPGLASDLSHILAARRAVKAQVIVRLLVPAIEDLYAREFAPE